MESSESRIPKIPTPPSAEGLVEKVAEGFGRELAEKTIDKLGDIATRLTDRNLLFIEDNETIKLAKELRKRKEYEVFSERVGDRDLRIQFQMGLTLRELEKQEKDLKPLIKRIIKTYKRKGLHRAEFVQNKLFMKYVAHLIETMQDVTIGINDLFENIDMRVCFIQGEDKVRVKSREIISKINAHDPETFILSSVGSASKNCRKIQATIMKELPDYRCELYQKDDPDDDIYDNRLIFFIIRREDA